FYTQGTAIYVAEKHGALQPKLLVSSLKLNHRCLGLVQRERGERGKSLRPFLRYCCEGIVDQSRQSDRPLRALHMSAWSGQGEDLLGDPVLLQNLLSVVEISVASHGCVVVAWIVQNRIAIRVHG